MADELNKQTLSQTDQKEGINIVAALEALLFVAPLPISVQQLSDVFEIKPREVEKRLNELKDLLADRGIRVQRHKNFISLVSAPEYAPLIESFLSMEVTNRLSQAALEALSIVAYKQPVTRPQIDAVRGVNSDGVIKNLLSKGLIEEVGRANSPGRPILYATTNEFMQYFGIQSLEELPPIEITHLVSKENVHKLKD